MRHGKKVNHLGRTHSHRAAMLSNMASSLIKHKRITTTVAKAKALRKYVEPLVTKSKSDTTHSRRVVFSYLQDKDAVTELFRDVSSKVGDRPGGYTRIIKIGSRPGDHAEMAMIELVDYNDLMQSDSSGKKKKSRRSRRSGAKKGAAVAGAVGELADKAEEAVDDVQDAVEDAVEDVEEVLEDAKEVVEDVVEDVVDTVKGEDDKKEKEDDQKEDEEGDKDKKE